MTEEYVTGLMETAVEKKLPSEVRFKGIFISACYYACPERRWLLLVNPEYRDGELKDEGIWRNGAAWEVYAGGFRRLVEEPYQSGIHPQMEALTEKEGKAGALRHAEMDGKITGKFVKGHRCGGAFSYGL